VVGLDILDAFCRRHADAAEQLRAWLAEVKDAHWTTPLELKERYHRASTLKDNRVVFRIKGDAYRLLAKVSYKNQVVRIEKIGTHAEYDKWDL
jgi:mRNA interferase HigB